MPRRSAERRGRPQADARGNADHPWRPPHWLAGSDALIRSAGADSTVAPIGAPPPLIFWRQTVRAVPCQRLGRKKNAPRERSCFIRPRAKRGRGGPSRKARWWRGSSVAAWFWSPEFRHRRGTPSTIVARCARSMVPSPAPLCGAGEDKGIAAILPPFAR